MRYVRSSHTFSSGTRTETPLPGLEGPLPYRTRSVKVRLDPNGSPQLPRRSWSLIWRGRTRILWRGLGSQIPIGFEGPGKGCERSVWVRSFSPTSDTCRLFTARTDRGAAGRGALWPWGAAAPRAGGGRQPQVIVFSWISWNEVVIEIWVRIDDRLCNGMK